MAATLYSFDGNTFSAQALPRAEADGPATSPSRAEHDQEQMWIDLVDPSDDDLQALALRVELPPSVIQEIKSNKGLRRFVPYEDGAMFLLLHRVFYRFDDDDSDFRPIGFYLSGHHLITFRTKNVSRLFERTVEKVRCSPLAHFEGGGLPVLIIILEGLFADYYPMLEKSSDELDTLESEVFRLSENDLQKKVVRELLKFKKLASAYRKAFISQRALLIELSEAVRTASRSRSTRKKPSDDSTDFSSLIKGLLDDWSALTSEVDSLNAHAGAVFEVYSTSLMIEMARSGSKQNTIMQRLNIMTAIFLPLTFIVGVYGMNIPNMPEFSLNHFYYILLTLMGFLVAAMLFVFKKIKWM